MAIELDDLAPNFRRATLRWPEAPTLSAHYASLQRAYQTGDHGLVGVAKSFVECVARTIIGEFTIDEPGSESATTLLTTALRYLGLKNSRGASKVDVILSTHNRLADVLSDLRNNHDPVAHGKDGFLESLTANEMRAFLVTADTVTALMLNAFDGREPDVGLTREPYHRFEHLHRRIDGRVPFKSSVELTDVGPTLVLNVETEAGGDDDAVPVELRFPLSQVLFALDRDAYLEVLNAAGRLPAPSIDEAEDEDEDSLASGEEAAPAETAPVPERATDTRQPPGPTHQGEFASVLANFDEAVRSHGIVEGDSSELATDLIAAAEGALGLDWKSRETVRAAMGVAMRRVLVRRGVNRDLADSAASSLLEWLIDHAPETSPVP